MEKSTYGASQKLLPVIRPVYLRTEHDVKYNETRGILRSCGYFLFVAGGTRNIVETAGATSRREQRDSEYNTWTGIFVQLGRGDLRATVKMLLLIVDFLLKRIYYERCGELYETANKICYCREDDDCIRVITFAWIPRKLCFPGCCGVLAFSENIWQIYGKRGECIRHSSGARNWTRAQQPPEKIWPGFPSANSG